jgi:hypothetical protein
MEVKGRVTRIVRPYSEDYAGWIEDMAMAIEEGVSTRLIEPQLADEVRDLGITERTRVRQRDARIAAANETGLDIDIFPEVCEWKVEQALDF